MGGNIRRPEANKAGPSFFAFKLEERMGHLLVGLTGGIATGKTTVADMFAHLGAHIIDYDILARTVVAPEEPAWHDILVYFGEAVINKDRTLNRGKLRAIVFADSEKRQKLESFIHPRLGALFQHQVAMIVKKDGNAIIQAVVPLLIETGMENMFDCLVMVYAPQQIQLKRLMARDQNTQSLAQRIIDSQMSVEEKKAKCDFIIDNTGTTEMTKQRVADVWQALRARQKER